MTDFRSLCSELTAALDQSQELLAHLMDGVVAEHSELIARARKALADASQDPWPQP